MRARDEQKQKAIKEKAMQIVAKQGIESLSMQKLAKAADVSPATLYIYFKDKEDLLLQLCKEAGEKMMEMTFKNFDPSMSFSEGLKMQWVNRAKYCLKYPDQLLFLEQIRYSRLHEKYMGMMNENFKINMQSFVHNAIKRKELVNLSVEVYWSIAFAPLYNLIKFHQAGKSFGGRKFVFSEKIMMETFELVLKALQP
ncbi:MAG TPA: TetR/AcrR family transcriptional regulator [Puia sp.]|nr:TetR/AcrR family transcriptional regulator [Puia sp.]